MKLSTAEAITVLKTPQSKKEIEQVRKHESQLRVFTEDLEESDLLGEVYWQNLMAKMKARADKKFDRVIQFARYPLPVTQISDSILSDFYKVFDGKNRHFQIEGDRDVSQLNEWKESANLEKWIEEQAIEVFKNKPCTFVVIDKNDKGVPYLISVDSNRIVDAQFKTKKGALEYIAFLHSTEIQDKKEVKYYSVYDEEFYRVFRCVDGEYVIEKEILHGLTYCPAHAFISTKSNNKNLFKRRTAFTGAVSKMEDWTQFDIYRNYVDHYAPFPVTESPSVSCPDINCVDGYVVEEVIDPKNTDHPIRKYVPCSACAAKNGDLIYPGTNIGINVQSKKELNDGSGVFKMIFPDTDKLKYTPEKLDDLEIEIRHKTVGLNYMNSTNEAMNELQTKGSFASMESVLLRNKKELDRIYKFIITTVAEMLYIDIKIKVDANYGTEFYLVSETELQKRFDDAKKAGLPIEEQLTIYKQLISTKYSGNPIKLNRQLILLDVDIFPLQTIEECVKLKSNSAIDDFELSYKVNFLRLISKFESENTLITNFALNLPYTERVKRIQDVLFLYNSDIIEEKNKRANPQKTDGGTEDDKPVVTQEQLEAQANLRGSVGGVQGILQTQAGVSGGTTDYEAAVAIMIEIYGFDDVTARRVLGTPGKPQDQV